MSKRLLRIIFFIGIVFLEVGSRPASAQEEMFVAGTWGGPIFGGTGIAAYPRAANGNVAPVRTISGDATGLRVPYGVAVDTVNNELIVTDYDNLAVNRVSVFALTANGNVAPLRGLSGPATGLFLPVGVAVDTIHNELIIADRGNRLLAVFARTASGNTAPLRTITAVQPTDLSLPERVVLDLAHDELLVANGIGSVAVYDRTANGSVPPLRTITGPDTGLYFPRGLAVDGVNNELIVVNWNNSITVYPRTANGNIAPLRTIVGAATELSYPMDVAIDTVNNELVVAGYLSIAVYSRTADGNVAPLRTVAGDATLINGSLYGVAITTSVESIAAPLLNAVALRKVHRAVGTFDLPLSLVPTNPTTEPRTGPAHTMVFTFDKPITSATATITEGTATAALPTFNGNQVIVGLTGVTNQQYVTVAVNNVNSIDGGAGGSGSVRVGFLLGDVNQSRAVTLSDLGQVNAQIAQPVTATNHLKDVNASGTLSLADKGITNTQITKVLPPP